jgi:hypothetical protein
MSSLFLVVAGIGAALAVVVVLLAMWTGGRREDR